MYRIIPLLILTTLLAGCASIDERKKTMNLDKSTRNYEKAIRWGEYGMAYGFIDHDEVNAPEPDLAYLKRIRVTHYEKMTTTVSADETEVRFNIDIRYYNEDTMREVNLIDRQTWKYNAEDELWLLYSPLPDFK